MSAVRQAETPASAFLDATILHRGNFCEVIRKSRRKS